MKKSISVSVAEPCHEDWGAMSPTQRGAFCKACSKEVFDFTTSTDHQIYHTLLGRTDACGRFLPEQLARPITVTVDRFPFISRIRRIAATAVSFFAIYRLSASVPDEMPKADAAVITVSDSALITGTALPVAQHVVLSGYVVDSATGAPVSHAVVKVVGTGISVRADSTGYFCIDSTWESARMPETPYRLIVRSAGYEARYMHVDSGFDQVDVKLKSIYTFNWEQEPISGNVCAGITLGWTTVVTDVTGLVSVSPPSIGLGKAFDSSRPEHKRSETDDMSPAETSGQTPAPAPDPVSPPPPLMERLSLWVSQRRREFYEHLKVRNN